MCTCEICGWTPDDDGICGCDLYDDRFDEVYEDFLESQVAPCGSTFCDQTCDTCFMIKQQEG
jgi:hypothetical protein